MEDHCSWMGVPSPLSSFISFITFYSRLKHGKVISSFPSRSLFPALCYVCSEAFYSKPHTGFAEDSSTAPFPHPRVPKPGLSLLAAASHRSNSLPSPLQTPRASSAAKSVIPYLVGSRDHFLQPHELPTLQKFTPLIQEEVRPNPCRCPLLLKYLLQPPAQLKASFSSTTQPVNEQVNTASIFQKEEAPRKTSLINCEEPDGPMSRPISG